MVYNILKIIHLFNFQGLNKLIKGDVETNMRPLLALFALLTGVQSLSVNIYSTGGTTVEFAEDVLVAELVEPVEETPNSCIMFTVGSGTGCDWMCSYCANQLGTTNYYFTDGVCKYESGGCVGSPVSGNSYTCCSV
jgi:hypothetical protein